MKFCKTWCGFFAGVSGLGLSGAAIYGATRVGYQWAHDATQHTINTFINSTMRISEMDAVVEIGPLNEAALPFKAENITFAVRGMLTPAMQDLMDRTPDVFASLTSGIFGEQTALILATVLIGTAAAIHAIRTNQRLHDLNKRLDRLEPAQGRELQIEEGYQPPRQKR